jgi:DNA-binding transcriptional LysR family regulator
MSDSPPVDLDLRLVRCFTVVAEHRHFGRAAAALHLTQSSLSRQIARLEQQVGARLLDRTPQGSTLTEAGEVFLPLAKASLRSTAQAVSRTRAAAQPSRITIGFITNMIITPAVRELRHRHPDAEVQTRYLDWNEPRAALLDHRVDAAVTRLPFPTDKLRVTVLYDEPRVVLVPVSHRLAGKESVTLDDLVDEPRIRASDPAGDAFTGVEPGSGGPVAKSIEDKFELVASGQAVAIIPAAAGISSVRPDLTTVPLDGVEPSHVVLATRADDRSRLVAAFRRYAEAQLTGPT